MWNLRGLARLGLAVMAVAAASAAWAAPQAQTVIAAIDLSGPFATRSHWRFTATQGPSMVDPIYGEGNVPGEVRPCLRKDASGPCDRQFQNTLEAFPNMEVFAKPHYLNKARIVRGASGSPLLLVQTASLLSGDSDQFVFTQALAYRRGSDQFVRVYARRTGRNNNQEVRFVESGPLKGDIISAEPTENAPFGFWIIVSALAREDRYGQVLRYRSATRYGDNNPLAVIDSEMPNIERRLGLWRPRSPLPLPARSCPAPRLVHMELWCAAPPRRAG